MVSIRELFFESGGVRCAADLYVPEAATDSLPCVAMGHGGSGTKRLGLQKYAQKFAARGMAVLAFDYRHFGESAGEPRQVIDIEQQRADYCAAISCARAHPGIDPDRIALWGTSLSGGHVLSVAARDGRLAAVRDRCDRCSCSALPWLDFAVISAISFMPLSATENARCAWADA